MFTLNPEYLSEEDFENIWLIKENKIPSLYDLGLINFLLSKREKNKKFENEIELLNMFHSCIFFIQNMNTICLLDFIISR